jgi:DNA-directed RNA polymerase specialized sigma subunit
LNDAVRGMSTSRPRSRSRVEESDLHADDSYADEEAIALLTVIAAELPPRDGEILLLRIRDGLTWTQIAGQLGIHRRTAFRDWRGILIRLRAEIHFRA